MTREEAIEELERLLSHWDDLENEKRNFLWYSKDAVGLAITALRPVSWEQVEKVWKGEWIKERGQTYIPVEYDEQGEAILHDFVVYRCSICGRENTKEEPFCNCGAPMTDEAVQMVMERIEETVSFWNGRRCMALSFWRH